MGEWLPCSEEPTIHCRAHSFHTAPSMESAGTMGAGKRICDNMLR